MLYDSKKSCIKWKNVSICCSNAGVSNRVNLCMCVTALSHMSNVVWMNDFCRKLERTIVLGGLKKRSYCAALNLSLQTAHSVKSRTFNGFLFHILLLLLSLSFSLSYSFSFHTLSFEVLSLSIFSLCYHLIPFFHYLYHSALGLSPSLRSYFRWLHLSLSHSLLLLTSRYLEGSLGDT